MLIGKSYPLPNGNIGVYIDQAINECAHKVALADEDVSITFKELGQRIDEMLYLFASLNLDMHSKIVVLMEPTYERTVAAYSIMRYGACYVPLDPDYPVERLKYILETSSASLILTNLDEHSLLDSTDVTKINIKKYISEENKEDIQFPYPSSTTTAYIIYTSGSTGKPKGVEVAHLSLVNHMLWIKKNFKLTDQDNFLFRTSPMFDASIWELLIPIFTGGKQVIAGKNTKLDLNLLHNFIIERKITVAQFVPTFFRELLKRMDEKSCPSLRYVFLGGEVITKDIKKSFFEKFNHCKLINLYGPTEATIDTSYYAFSKREFDLNNDIIGMPIFNTMLYILDNKLNPVKKEQVGELYIGGISLAKGYLENAPLTKLKFIETPFGRLYKTGDLVKKKNNLLIYLGRDDDQVKINGIRIDLQEIISTISEKFPVIKNCVVLKNNLTDTLSNSLVCFIEANKKEAPNPETVKKFLESFYPTPLVPKHICIFENFPCLPNGKLDKSRLFAALEEERNIAQNTIESNDSFEQGLYNIWSHILDSAISIDLTFFDNGGDSIAVIQLSDQIHEEFGVNLSITDIINNPTITKQANLIKLKKALSNQAHDTYPETSIISLNAFQKNKPNIFLVHPIGGTIFWYINIAKHLDGIFNIYGIQDPDIEGLPHPPFLTIQDMSEYYGEKILALIDANQPFFIGGASFGTNVAIDIANYLLKKNKRAACLMSFDGWGVYPESFHNFSVFKDLMQSQYEKLLIESLGAKYVENINPLFDMQQRRLNLLNNYQPNMPDIPFYLFKAKEQTGIFQKFNHPHNFWNDHIINLKTIVIPGDHETMFNQQNSKVLAEKMKEQLSPFLIKKTFSKLNIKLWIKKLWLARKK